jgi:hypothetical protein
LRDSILQGWIQSESTRAVNWYWSTVSPEERALALNSLITLWSPANKVVDGKEESLAWLKRQPPKSLPPDAPEIFFNVYQWGDLPTALRDWLELVPSPEAQLNAAGRLAKTIANRSRNIHLPHALREAGFSEELSRAVLESQETTN